MKIYLSFIIKSALYWILVFFLFRLIFFFQLTPWNDGGGVLHSLQSFIYGFRLDLSVTSYILVIPFILKSIELFVKSNFFTKAINTLHSFILAIVVLTCTGNMVVYSHWGTMINNRAIAFLSDPAEVFASASIKLVIFGTLALVLIYFILLFVYIRKINTLKIPAGGFKIKSIGYIFLLVTLIIIGSRGGIQQIPINESASYFSEHPKVNHIATNPVWHLASNLKQASIQNENPYIFLAYEEAEAIIDSLIVDDKKNNLLEIINKKSAPNIIMIILESWTADVIEPLGGDVGVTPQFNQLVQEGLLFTQMYSSGFRTDQALTSILSGFPSQPNKSIIRFPSKTIKLPSLPKELHKSGYNTSFYYGGELGFASMHSYLLSQNMGTIISKDDFNSEDMNSKWGAHDGVVFDMMQNDLDKMSTPFFTTILTLSTHEPFEVPMNSKFNGDNEPDMFRNSAFYTDSCLGDFINKIKDKQWYQNTLLLLVADHGHTLPWNRYFYDPDTRKIPFLITGGALKNEWRGKQIDNISNQHDIPSTILTQLELDASSFKWSNNLLDTLRNDFAYISQDNLFTFIEESGTRTRNIQFVNKVNFSKYSNVDDTSAIAVTANAYLQMLFYDFLQY